VRQTLSFCSTPRTLRPRDCSAGPVTHSSPAFLGWPQDASHCQKQNPTETVLWGKLSIISEGDKGDAQGPPLPQLPVRGQWRVGLLTDQLAQAKEMLGDRAQLRTCPPPPVPAHRDHSQAASPSMACSEHLEVWPGSGKCSCHTFVSSNFTSLPGNTRSSRWARIWKRSPSCGWHFSVVVSLLEKIKWTGFDSGDELEFSRHLASGSLLDKSTVPKAALARCQLSSDAMGHSSTN
jgi:hypothetical protein